MLTCGKQTLMQEIANVRLINLFVSDISNVILVMGLVLILVHFGTSTNYYECGMPLLLQACAIDIKSSAESVFCNATQ